MSYSYDSETKEVKENGNTVGWAAALAVATTLIALLTAILTGSPAGLLMTFSSIPAPPAPVTYWDKALLRDGYPVNWGATTVVTQGTRLQVGDVITSAGAFTLTETWDDDVLGLTGYITTTGAVVTATNALTWTADTSGSLVKSWLVLTSTWPATYTHIVESLSGITGTRSVTLTLVLGAVPPTPTPPPPTPPPTFTPYYTPAPWIGTVFPTPTPCVGFGCEPLEPSITYKIYLPLILQAYP
jgi:hypothetical protein